MERRKFIKQSILASITSMTCAPVLRTLNGQSDSSGFIRVDATIDTMKPIELPKEKRVPLGYNVLSVPGKKYQNPVLTFKNLPSKETHSQVWLRLTSAVDFREEKTIKAYLAKSQREIGTFRIIYAHPFQPFEIPVRTEYAHLIENEGIELRLTQGDQTAWFFAEVGKADQGLNPYLLFANNTAGDLDDFQENLYSMNSFGPFGWIGGCVLDALWERHLRGDQKALATLQLHLNKFLNEKWGVIYENPRTKPMDGSFNSIEDFLPFVPIAGLYPEHISIDNAVEYLIARKDDENLIYQGHITTEGCYTVAYSLAFIAAISKDRNLAQLAVDQLVLRMKILQEGNVIFQRATSAGERSYKNWGRGVAWYLLGMVKTMKILQSNGMKGFKGEEEIIAAIPKLVSSLITHQNPQGMWCAYIDQPDTLPDTSATAGIATAIANAVRLGLLPNEMLANSEKAFSGLQKYLAPDGWLQGMTQINRGGQDLQASGYRLMSHFGLGLMAQLQTVLD